MSGDLVCQVAYGFQLETHDARGRFDQRGNGPGLWSNTRLSIAISCVGCLRTLALRRPRCMVSPRSCQLEFAVEGRPMSICNRLTEALAISVPIIQAPMAGGGDTAELVVAVSNAGGLGSIGAAYLTPEQIIERGRAVRSQTSQPFGINLFAPLLEANAGADSIARAVAAITPYYQELG